MNLRKWSILHIPQEIIGSKVHVYNFLGGRAFQLYMRLRNDVLENFQIIPVCFVTSNVALG